MYYLFILVVGVERLIEMVVSRRNANWSFANGGREFGRGHFPAMIAMHTLLLVSCIAEVAVFHRPFLPWLGWPMLALLVASHALRWWCISTLGHQWCTRIVVVPGLPAVTSGPYRFLRHPNYLAVVLEGIALPLVHTAWITAAVFTVANAALLRVRIAAEERALRSLV